MPPHHIPEDTAKEKKKAHTRSIRRVSQRSERLGLILAEHVQTGADRVLTNRLLLPAGRSLRRGDVTEHIRCLSYVVVISRR